MMLALAMCLLLTTIFVIGLTVVIRAVGAPDWVFGTVIALAIAWSFWKLSGECTRRDSANVGAKRG